MNECFIVCRAALILIVKNYIKVKSEKRITPIRV